MIYNSVQEYIEINKIPFPNLTANEGLLDMFVDLMKAYLITNNYGIEDGTLPAALEDVSSRTFHTLISLFQYYDSTMSGYSGKFVSDSITRYCRGCLSSYNAEPPGMGLQVDDYADCTGIKLRLDSDGCINIRCLTDLFIYIASHIQEFRTRGDFVI